MEIEITIKQKIWDWYKKEKKIPEPNEIIDKAIEISIREVKKMNEKLKELIKDKVQREKMNLDQSIEYIYEVLKEKKEWN